mmetsp:Transcript_90600/g.163479  ORF Transcript_90600/g.163479 Transcript_90600/m.163479 type:complete len:179 (-) Transcript_90600:149-685(-)
MSHGGGKARSASLIIAGALMAFATCVTLGLRGAAWLAAPAATSSSASVRDGRRELLAGLVGVATSSSVAFGQSSAEAAEGPIINLSSKLCSDKECKHQFKQVDGGRVTLGKCEYSDADGVSVFYECVEGSKLHFKLYFLSKTCEGPPKLEIDIPHNQCTVMPGLGSGTWLWSGGCGQA